MQGFDLRTPLKVLKGGLHGSGMSDPIINAPKSKVVLLSAAQTRNSTGLNIYTCIVLTLEGGQNIFSQPYQYLNFLYQGSEINGFYASKM